MPVAVSTPASARIRRSTLLVATLASFLTPFLGSAVNVALPAIGSDLGMDAVHLSWVATAFLLTSAVCLVPCGRLADLVGRPKVFLAGMGVFTLASLACGLTRHALTLVAWRAVQGTGAAMIFGTGLALLTSVFPPGERGRVIGFNVAVVYLGLSVGPFVGGLLTQHWGWPSIFLTAAPLGLITLVVAWRGLPPEQGSEAGGRFDYLGSLLYGLAFVALMIGLSWLPSTRGAVLATSGGMLFGVFWWWERRVASPVFEVALLQGNPVFARSNLAAFINYSATFAVTFLLSLYLQSVRGLAPRQAGLILLTQSLVMAAVSSFAGRLSDRLEPRIVASTGMGLTVVGLLGLAGLDASTPYPAILGALIVLGAGFGLFSSPNTNAVMSSVEKRQLGVASATLGTMRLAGQMISMGIAVLVLALYVGPVSLTPALQAPLLRAVRMAFLIFAALCGVGVFASLARGKVRASPAGAKPPAA